MGKAKKIKRHGDVMKSYQKQRMVKIEKRNQRGCCRVSELSFPNHNDVHMKVKKKKNENKAQSFPLRS